MPIPPQIPAPSFMVSSEDVAEELRRLRYHPQVIEAMDAQERMKAKYQNLLIDAAAKRLGIVL